MTSEARTFMGTRTQDTNTAHLARAVAAELRRRYPHHTAKSVARDLDCTPKAAANLLDGHLSAASARLLILAYGPGWVSERVFESASDTMAAYIRAQAEEARATALHLQEKVEELAQLENDVDAVRRARTAGGMGSDP